MVKDVEIIPAGEARVSSSVNKVFITYTGSCIALTLYDIKKSIGGVAHIVMPGARKSTTQTHGDSYYADQAVKNLINKLTECGAESGSLKATISGGRINFVDSFGEDIGRQNALTVKKSLEDLKIDVQESSVGGYQGRRVQFMISSGTVTVDDINTLKIDLPKEDSSSNKETFSRFLASLKSDPVISEALLQECHSDLDSINLEKIRELVCRDFSLIIQFLKLANNPYYGNPGNINSINTGFKFLEPTQIRRICLVMAVNRHHSESKQLIVPFIRQASLHGRVVAEIADQISGVYQISSIDLLHSVALIHSIFPLVRNSLNLEETETSSLIINLLGSWGIPLELPRLISSTNSISDLANDENRIGLCVREACVIAHLLNFEHCFDGDFLNKNEQTHPLSKSSLAKLPAISEELKEKGFNLGRE